MKTPKEIRYGKELAEKGADHLNYIMAMPKKEYELTYPEGKTPQETLDNENFALHQAMLGDLSAHSFVCDGCSSKTLNAAKKLVRKLERTKDELA